MVVAVAEIYFVAVAADIGENDEKAEFAVGGAVDDDAEKIGYFDFAAGVIDDTVVVTNYAVAGNIVVVVVFYYH